MATDNLAGVGERERISLGGENFYLLVVLENGVPSITATVPHENRPDQADLRQVVEMVCTRANAMITRLMAARP